MTRCPICKSEMIWFQTDEYTTLWYCTECSEGYHALQMTDGTFRIVSSKVAFITGNDLLDGL